ncbi:hypothetical protein GQ54DRAFT_302908 [Martensiomyces pterosporus]|nr:hypothetical protein GQ54DRAFT_302908 [Martensiomyces pterosporus]
MPTLRLCREFRVREVSAAGLPGVNPAVPRRSPFARPGRPEGAPCGPGPALRVLGAAAAALAAAALAAACSPWADLANPSNKRNPQGAWVVGRGEVLGEGALSFNMDCLLL